jgi:Flp pilus assembly protein TadB
MPGRYEKEIEEILEQAGNVQPQSATPHPGSGRFYRLRSQIAQAFSARGWKVSPGKLMLVSVGLLLVALLMNAVIPAAVGPVAWAGIVLFIVAYALFFILPPKSKVERHWRGRPVDYAPRSWRGRFLPWNRP